MNKFTKEKREAVSQRQQLERVQFDFSRQGIETKYLGPTNTKPGRIRATAAAGSITIEYDHELNAEQCHLKAAVALANKFGWSFKKMASGGNAKGTGYLYVLIS